jgi:hypothetical protein
VSAEALPMGGVPPAAAPAVRELEVRRRRAGALHPDACPKLHLVGVAFAVPPRELRIVPRFDGGQVRAEVAGLNSDEPAARLLALARLSAGRRCRRCGNVAGEGLELSPQRDGEFLGECFALARRLLLSQYELSDGELAELLSFGAAAAPVWIAQLLRWCAGGNEPAPSPATPPARRRHWWPWRRQAARPALTKRRTSRYARGGI